MDLVHLSQDIKELWNEWQIRSLMLLSLLLQIFLSIFGKRRKFTTARWLGHSLWVAYLSADWVATFSLGILARSEADSTNPNLIPVFWAPILLVHLGGPGTITAYSVDRVNKLFLSRLLQLVTQVGVACYVLFRLWSKNVITSVVIPILISGIIKYGERIWVLTRSHEENNLSQQPSAKVSCIRSAEFPNNNRIHEFRYIHDAYLLFQALQTLFKNFDLLNLDQKITYGLVSENNAEEAFQLIEVELGFKYDRLYYKVTTISWLRIILRSITFLSSIFALVSFSTMTKSKCVYSRNDRIISYVLLIGVVGLESYSIIEYLLSDWGKIWLSRSKIANVILSQINCLSSLPSFCWRSKRWSGSMGQHSLISAQSNKQANKFLKKYFPGKWNVDSRVKVDKKLKELIFKQVSNKRSRYDPSTSDFIALEKLLEERGEEVLRNEKLAGKDCFGKFGWSVAGVEFIHSLLTWHIATHFCYLDDSRKNGFDKNRYCVMSSRSLSNYMLYLLVNCPTMLAIEPSETRLADTRNHLRRLLFWNTHKEAKLNITVDELDALSFREAEVNAFFTELLQSPSIMLKEIKQQDEVSPTRWLHACFVIAVTGDTAWLAK